MLAVLFLYVDVMVNLGFPGSSTEKESACNAGNPSHSWARKIPWRRDRLPTLVFLGFPGGLDGKESTCNVGDLGLIPGLERTPGGHSNLLQYSCLENPHGERSLAVYSPWSCKESDTTEQLSTANEIPAIKSYRSHHSPDRHQNLC